MSAELRKAIEQISKDRGIDKDLLIDTLERAVRSSVTKKLGEDVDIEVTFNEDKGGFDVYQFKRVVQEIKDPISEILLEDAKNHDPNVQVDDELGFELKVEDLGRIAAQSAKQVIIQRMREAEQEIIYEEYKDRKREIVSGTIQRRDRSGWIINLGRTEALLPKEEQISKERFRRGDQIQALLYDVRKEGRGPQIIVSRSHPDYLTVLFNREVPEVADGFVRIMGVARDPGSRAKVAVMSTDRDVDPVGACVGVRGSRIQNIVQELRGERIDIIVWSPEITTYAVNALSPARISRITVDEEDGVLEVVVPDDQLTLAIGRKGQNVKLAAKLLGWKIDIFTESRYGAMYKDRQSLEQLANVAEIPFEAFLAAGFDGATAVAEAEDEQLLAIQGLDAEKVADIRSAINFLGLDGRMEEGDGAVSDAEGESNAEVSEVDAVLDESEMDEEGDLAARQMEQRDSSEIEDAEEPVSGDPGSAPLK
ncbi:NusA antitermination factor [Desulfonatronum thiosulfatophilum]|uniref:Transcription termination/antitermination protein NusA n=1 Tax=Desulfonatronum thiosulfatophilum TaxID=617002 RepID=A0A1G6DIN5_9BACT|nr:transcription termination factor NusA [Desulfonatronum thiosulfatophilum]SDB44982.1 NusA antitermination factor [Desulfonatronum thiosulfatophilum]